MLLSPFSNRRRVQGDRTCIIGRNRALRACWPRRGASAGASTPQSGTLCSMKLLLLVLATVAFAQQAPKPELLWPDGAPGALGTEDVDKPTLAAYVVPQGRGV